MFPRYSGFIFHVLDPVRRFREITQLCLHTFFVLVLEIPAYFLPSGSLYVNVIIRLPYHNFKSGRSSNIERAPPFLVLIFLLFTQILTSDGHDHIFRTCLVCAGDI